MAKDDYFVIVYKILRTLRAAMKVEEFDPEQISPEILRIGVEYWEQILIMMYEEGYIKGVKPIPILGRPTKGVKVGAIRITQKGLEYLQENSMMKKVSDLVKGIGEFIN
jgi:hypothetical protein